MSGLGSRVRWVAKQLVYNIKQSGSLLELEILCVGEDFPLDLVRQDRAAAKGAFFASMNFPPGCPFDHSRRRREQRQGDLALLTMLNQPMCQTIRKVVLLRSSITMRAACSSSTRSPWISKRRWRPFSKRGGGVDHCGGDEEADVDQEGLADVAAVDVGVVALEVDDVLPPLSDEGAEQAGLAEALGAGGADEVALPPPTAPQAGEISIGGGGMVRLGPWAACRCCVSLACLGRGAAESNRRKRHGARRAVLGRSSPVRLLGQTVQHRCIVA